MPCQCQGSELDNYYTWNVKMWSVMPNSRRHIQTIYNTFSIHRSDRLNIRSGFKHHMSTCSTNIFAWTTQNH